MAAVGDVVLYGVSADDQNVISLRTPIKGTGLGRYSRAGDVLPALVTTVNGDGTLDLVVQLNGSAQHWRMGVAQGAANTAGSWWPKP